MLKTTIEIRGEVKIEGTSFDELREARKAVIAKMETLGIEENAVSRIGSAIDAQGKIQIDIPDTFSMFTAKGDAAIKGMAMGLMDAINLAQDKAQRFAAFLSYFETYCEFKENPLEGCEEASDTAVRGAVWEFAVHIAYAYHYTYDDLDQLWNKAMA